MPLGPLLCGWRQVCVPNGHLFRTRKLLADQLHLLALAERPSRRALHVRRRRRRILGLSRQRVSGTRVQQRHQRLRLSGWVLRGERGHVHPVPSWVVLYRREQHPELPDVCDVPGEGGVCRRVSVRRRVLRRARRKLHVVSGWFMVFKVTAEQLPGKRDVGARVECSNILLLPGWLRRGERGGLCGVR